MTSTRTAPARSLPSNRNCVPSDADGTTWFRTYEWNGDDYFTELCTFPNLPPVPIQATKGVGGTIVSCKSPEGTCGVSSNVGDAADDGTFWRAVWYEGVSGWSQIDAFVEPPIEPPWPDDVDPWATDSSGSV